MMKRVFLMLIAVVAMGLSAFAQNGLSAGFEEYKLANGMTVYLWVDKEQPNVYGQVSVRAGSIDEPADFTGLAHYLEHMLFKGTQEIGAFDWKKEEPMYKEIIRLYDELSKLRNPKKDKAKREELMKRINELSVEVSKITKGYEFATLIQSIGGTQLNAYTSFDQTVYHNTFPTAQTEKWLKLYADHFRNPVFREFQAEMENVFEELNMRTPNVGYQQFISLYERLLAGSNYARGVMGSPEHLKNPSLTPMIKFFEDWYVPNNMGLLLYGNFDPQEVKPMIEKTFGKMPYKELPKRVPTVPTKLTKNQTSKIKIGYSPSFVWGYEGVKKGHPDELKIDFMLALLNNGYGTGLLDKLGIEGTIGGASASSMSLRDCGMIVIQGSPYYDVSQNTYESDRATERLIMAEVNKLKRGQVPLWLFQSVKDSYLQSLKLMAESAGSKISIATDSYVYGIDMKEYFNMEEKIKAITMDDVKEMANKYFSGYYHTVLFSPGDPKIELFPRANIKRLECPAEGYSEYYKNFVNIPVKESQPRFIDFSDVQEADLFRDGSKLKYVKNEKNDIFSMVIEYKVGTHTDPKLEYAATLLNYAGLQPSMSNNDFRRELAKYGATYGVGAGVNTVQIQINGNEKNLSDIMPLIGRLFLMPKLDNKQIEGVMGSEVQRRMFEKRIPGLITAALMEYIQFGDKSYFIDRIPSKELIFMGQTGYNFLITNADLTKAVQSITSYPVTVHYTGAKPFAEVAEILQGVPKQDVELPAQEEYYRPRVEHKEAQIYFLHNADIQQAEVKIYFPMGDYDKSESVQYEVFNQYFGGGGLNDLCFVNIREESSLAYSTYGIAVGEPLQKTSYFIGSTGTQNDKVNTVIDVYMDLLKNMPVYPSKINDIKTNVKASILDNYISFRAKSRYKEQLQKIGYTEDPAKGMLRELENVDFNTITDFYKKKIKDAPVIIVIHGNRKYIDLKDIEKKYGKVNNVPLNNIFKGGDVF